MSRRKRFVTLFRTLKFRLILIQLSGVIIPLSLLGVVSYYSIYSIMVNKLDNGVEHSLGQVKQGIEASLNGLEYASLQLSYEGGLGRKLNDYLTADKLSEKLRISKEIQENVVLVNFTNKVLGVIGYYFPRGGDMTFENMEVNKAFRPDELAIFQTGKDAVFHGPHPSAYRYGSYTVFSILRKVELPEEREPVYVYLESNIKQFEQTLSKDRYGMDAIHLILNAQDIVIYSDNNERFPVGQALSSLRTDGLVLFQSRSAQNWTVAAAIDRSEYLSEVNRWLSSLSGIIALALLLALAFAWLLWRIIHRPMNHMVRAITSVEMSNFSQPIKGSKIVEFDAVLHKFQSMRLRIAELLTDVEQKERLKGKLEVEKLLHQINPHFLYNSLNTIQWLARMKGEPEIDRLVTVLTRVLRYNIGKEGGLVMLREELEALADYVELQAVRYDYRFKVEYEVEDGADDFLVPRFLLQPLVENALYHGMRDEDGLIRVTIRTEAGGRLFIRVSDNGAGIAEEEIARLLRRDADAPFQYGLGVGLNYVVRIIESHFGRDCSFQFESRIGAGSAVTIVVPMRRRSEP